MFWSPICIEWTVPGKGQRASSANMSTLVDQYCIKHLKTFFCCCCFLSDLQQTTSRRWVCHGTAHWRRRFLSMPSLIGAPHQEQGRGSWCHHHTRLVVAKPPTNPWSYGALWTVGHVQCWSPHRIWSLLWSTAWWPALCLAPSSPQPLPWSHLASSATPQ